MPLQVPTVSAAQVPPDAVLLDVREDDEWAAGHIAGATHIPLGSLVARADELPSADQVVVVCGIGMRSAQATAYLLSRGVAAVNLEGGMHAWAAAGRPMVTDSGAQPDVI